MDSRTSTRRCVPPGTFLAPHRLAFGLDNDSLVVLDCSSGGLAAEGWPKFGRTLGQNGVV